ncbi:hypothetical protein PRIPAC_73202, partial [Pristionchus pacificus]|uniref:Uncharacterized protein n=1 Tax=Pristionchus pacificus TaxID=54126 RepID=A0A2A6BGI6_PRIPA
TRPDPTDRSGLAGPSPTRPFTLKIEYPSRILGDRWVSVTHNRITASVADDNYTAGHVRWSRPVRRAVHYGRVDLERATGQNNDSLHFPCSLALSDRGKTDRK